MLLIAKHVALYGVLAIGTTYVIVTGGIDFSAGAVIGLAGTTVGGSTNRGLILPMFGVTLYFDVPLIVLITITVGVLAGWSNGIMIARFNVAPLVTTLGMMHVARDPAMLYSNGTTYSNIIGKPVPGNTGYDFFGSNTMSISVDVIILVIAAVIATILSKLMPLGWYVSAIGGNEKATKLSGIRVNQVKIMAYILSGVCAATVGIANSAQLVAAHPVSGESRGMNAIAATVLGGTPMTGGIGGIGGTTVGVFVIGAISDGIVMCGVSEFWQTVIKGLVIVSAVVIGQSQRNL